MNTVLVVDLIKGVPCPWPRLESDTHDTNYTSIAKMPKRYLAPGAVMDGAHARLRDLTGEYRR
jgi:hypothetical protein